MDLQIHAPAPIHLCFVVLTFNGTRSSINDCFIESEPATKCVSSARASFLRPR